MEKEEVAPMLGTKQPKNKAAEEQSSRWDKAAGTKNKAAVLGTKEQTTEEVIYHLF
jgi:hypothetical protein